MTPEDFASLKATHASLASNHEDMRKDIANIRIELSANTVVTTEVRDLLNMARGTLRALDGLGTIIRWIGGLATAAVAVWGLIWLAIHGGKP